MRIHSRVLLFTVAMLALSVTYCFGAPFTIYFKDGRYVTFDTDEIDRMVYAAPSGQSAAGSQSAANLPPANFSTVLSREEFESGLGANWLPLSAAGGDFNRFARLHNGFVVIDVPAGNWWGKTGVMSAGPILTVSPDGPTTIIIKADPAKTSSFVVSLSAVQGYEDIWHQTNLWFHYVGPKADSPAVACFVDAHGAFKCNGDGLYHPKSQAAPGWMAVTVGPGEASVLLEGEATPAYGGFPWMKAGTPLYLYVFSCASGDNLSGSIALDSITVVK